MTKRNSYINLTKNVGILTLGSFGSKLLSYFLLPLYTSYLSTAEYGSYDLLSATINFIIPLLTVNAAASLMRFSLDKDTDPSNVITTGFFIVLKGLAVFLCFVIINRAFGLFDIVNQYLLYFVLLYILSVSSQILGSIAKGLEDLTGMAINGVVHTLFLLLLNILFLVQLDMKLDGYFLANIISLVISSLYLVLRLRIWNYISFQSFSYSIEKKMLKYGGPLIATSIGWWINNMSDRYVITWLCGIGANGVYSVAYKIPSILMTLQSIFNQAWQISTVGEYNKNDSNGFFSNIYNLFNMLNVLGCSVFIVLTKVFARLLFAKEFYTAWQYAPFLMISVVFGSLIGVIDGIFQAVKDSKIQSKSVAFGAIVNLVLNIAFVYLWGPIGAAVSTAIAYFVTWIISFINVKKYIVLKIKIKKHMWSYIILLIQSIDFVFGGSDITRYIVQICFVLVLILLYAGEIRSIIDVVTKQKSKNLISD